ncbi:hypothetical protein [Pseudoalteromonas sp. S2755]|uniref:hypothetical protein n=1 Tax=Pseudoalteromonas sp. S2755 TaxID=2066523 RepID=UPI00110A86CC|nr:hypothetical protein [Pseudoalteromonas sp. S2755]
MAIINSACTCGRKITVATGADSMSNHRKDGKQAYYPEHLPSVEYNYSIFRCESCGKPASETVKGYEYDL